MANYQENRPWGSFEVLCEASNHKVKRIIVKPNSRLSLQSHEHRAEHWFIIQGQGTVVINESTLKVSAGQAVDIPLQAKHRIENSGNLELIFIEVQTGNSFAEDDIIRYQDDYQRQ